MIDSFKRWLILAPFRHRCIVEVKFLEAIGSCTVIRLGRLTVSALANGTGATSEVIEADVAHKPQVTLGTDYSHTS